MKVMYTQLKYMSRMEGVKRLTDAQLDSEIAKTRANLNRSMNSASASKGFNKMNSAHFVRSHTIYLRDLLKIKASRK